MNHKIIVAGHVCLDMTPMFPSKINGNMGQLLTPGKLIHMKGVDIHTGGTVSNTGLALHKLGANVSLMGKIGDDAFGSIIMDMFRTVNLEGDMIQSKECNTSYSIVLAPPGTDRIFLHDPGANDTYGVDDLDFTKIASGSLFHLGYPPLMRRLYENTGEELFTILKKVKEMGIMTSVDMATVDENSDAATADWEAILKKILPYVDFFMPSVEELAYMIDKELYKTWKDRAVSKDITLFIKKEEVDRLANKLIEWGGKIILIKCGAPGMYLKTSEDTEFCKRHNQTQWSGISHFETSYEPELILSGTGAGDTSIAAFLYAFIEGYPWERCMEFAVATGAACLSRYDATSGLKTLDELKSKIDQGWKKQNLLYEDRKTSEVFK